MKFSCTWFAIKCYERLYTKVLREKILSKNKVCLLGYVAQLYTGIQKDNYVIIQIVIITLRKHAYLNILKIFPPKYENVQIKNSDIFHISAQNIDCGYSLEPPRRGGSNEYPQSMFRAEIRKIMYTPVNPQFYYIKVGFKGVKII